jgi:hypothetical protein
LLYIGHISPKDPTHQIPTFIAPSQIQSLHGLEPMCWKGIVSTSHILGGLGKSHGQGVNMATPCFYKGCS